MQCARNSEVNKDKLIIQKIDRALEVVVIVLFLAIVMIGALQIFNRFVLDRPLSWTEEAQRFAFIWLVFLAIPLGYSRGSHIVVDLVIDRLPDRWIAIAAGVIDFLWAFVSVTILVASWPLIRVARFQLSPALELPMHVVYLVIPIAFGYIALLSASRILQRLQGKEAGSC